MASEPRPSSHRPKPDTGSTDRPLPDRKVLVAVAGGIAAFKTASLVSRLVQAGASVRVVMTEAATKFVAPLTFESLSGSPVVTSIFQAVDHRDSQHVGLARWCELMVIAPATADLIAKLAAGFCDDPVTLIAAALPRHTPVLLAPAMNAEMWENPVTQRNLATIKKLLKHHVVGPDEGWQACRTLGPGRMSDPDAIFERAQKILSSP